MVVSCGRRITSQIQRSMQRFPGAWSSKSADLGETHAAWQILERMRGKRVPIVLYILWFVWVRLLVVLPVYELRTVGGLRTAGGLRMARPGGVLRALLLPLRLALLPLHALLAALAYTLMVVFSGRIMGWTGKHALQPPRQASVATPTAIAAIGQALAPIRTKTDTVRVAARAAPPARPHWLLRRLVDPYRVLMMYTSPEHNARTNAAAARKPSAKPARTEPERQLGVAKPSVNFYKIVDKCIDEEYVDRNPSDSESDYDEDEDVVTMVDYDEDEDVVTMVDEDEDEDEDVEAAEAAEDATINDLEMGGTFAVRSGRSPFEVYSLPGLRCRCR